jgi:hypothetical protein
MRVGKILNHMATELNNANASVFIQYWWIYWRLIDEGQI